MATNGIKDLKAEHLSNVLAVNLLYGTSKELTKKEERRGDTDGFLSVDGRKKFKHI